MISLCLGLDFGVYGIYLEKYMIGRFLEVGDFLVIVFGIVFFSVLCYFVFWVIVSSS